MNGYAQGPLVTFALFAYNQQRYIREAVEGAFAQTYSPLEIILSDDCSSDSTFQIMREMASSYHGPHSVVVRQNARNIGIIDHVLTVARSSHGKLMIVAAGDDVSLPTRSSRLVSAWTETGASALYSASSTITDEGRVVKELDVPAPLARIQDLFEGCLAPRRHNQLVRHIPGYSAAYDVDFLSELPLTDSGVHNEDALMTYLANLEGREICAVDDALMLRRISSTSISAMSTFNSIGDVRSNELRIKAFSQSSLMFLDYLYSLPRFKESADFETIKDRLDKNRNFLHTCSIFWDRSLAGRIRSAALARDGGSLKYMLPRLLGMRLFCFLKYWYSSLAK